MQKVLLAGTLLLFIFNSTISHGQSHYSDKAYRKFPHWISMMDDTLSNYFEAQKAFELYWSVHEKPKEEEDIIGMKGAGEQEKSAKENWLRRLFKRSRNENENEMAFSVKRFNHWLMVSAPWVQEDGRILYPSERQAILDSIRR